MKRISIIVVLAFLFTTMVASANPFSDVPFSHWAYDAVNKLAAKGLLQGYPDGTYKGEKKVTRYALAMVTAKMLANVEQMMEHGFGGNLVTKADLQTLEKLTVEFADELALLGVKVTALEDDMQVVKEDVSILKRDVEGIKDYMAKGGMEKVKLSGDMLVRHTSMVHNRDWNNIGGNIGNANNVQTQTQLRFQFKASIDENITAVARWHMLDKVNSSLGTANNALSVFGNNGLGNGIRNNADASANIDLAYLHIKDMFRFGGDFTFGRNFYSTGHALLLSDYVDALHYYKRSGDVDVGFISMYDRHRGNYKDQAQGNDFRNVWGVTLGTKYRDHDLYLNFYGQDEPNQMNRRFAAGLGLSKAASAVGAVPNQSKDALLDIEFGGKGPLGRNGHWDYDLGFAYQMYQGDLVSGATIATNANGAAGNNWSDVEMNGWLGHVGVKWDSKKEWAAKLAYTFATDEAMGALSLDNDRRYDDGIETPYEDISRGNTYFTNGLLNMYDLKLQVEYRPRDTKHYFRLAGDFLDEVKDTVSHDFARLAAGRHFPAVSDVAAGATKTNTAYDRWNNLLTSDPSTTVLTFEYRYQLAENTRIRVGWTAFDMDGNFRKFVTGLPALKAGRGNVGDYDYNMFWAELYSRF